MFLQRFTRRYWVSMSHQWYTWRGYVIPWWWRCPFPVAALSSLDEAICQMELEARWLETSGIAGKGKGGVGSWDEDVDLVGIGTDMDLSDALQDKELDFGDE